MTVPVHISGLREAPDTERGITENVSAHGLRVVTQRKIEPDELLLVTSGPVNLRTQARVVYCQPLSQGSYGVGLQLQKEESRWLGVAGD